MSHRSKAFLTAMAFWQLVCLAMIVVYRNAVAHLMFAAYGVWFGDVQSSYGSFERLATYVGIGVITCPATMVSLWLYDCLSNRRTKPKQAMVCFLAWQLAVVALLICSYEVSFPFKLNQLGWAFFGARENIYSFRNLVLHRIVAWLLCTAPVAWVALWRYSISAAPGTIGKSRS